MKGRCGLQHRYAPIGLQKMSNGFAVPLFYLIVAAIWVFIKVTKSHERQSMLWWFFVFVACFGGAGLLYTMFTTGNVPSPSGLPYQGPQ